MPWKSLSPGDGEPEPAELPDALPRWSGPEDAFEDLPALRTLHRNVGELVGGRPDPGVEPAPLRLLAQPQPREVVAADPPEVVVPEPEDGAVVDHPAVLVAHRGIGPPAPPRACACPGSRRAASAPRRRGRGPRTCEAARGPSPPLAPGRPQYSPIAPWAGKSCASQYPLYSTKFRVCAAKQSWNPVCFVIRTSASAVMRNPLAGLKSSFRSYTRNWTSVGSIRSRGRRRMDRRWRSRRGR